MGHDSYPCTVSAAIWSSPPPSWPTLRRDRPMIALALSYQNSLAPVSNYGGVFSSLPASSVIDASPLFIVLYGNPGTCCGVVYAGCHVDHTRSVRFGKDGTGHPMPGHSLQGGQHNTLCPE